MQLATYKSMLTKASNDLAKPKQLVGLLKQQIEQGNTELSEELDKANERISMLSESAPEQPAVKLPKKTEKEKQESDSQLPRKRYTTTARVLKSFGIDKSDLPENARLSYVRVRRTCG